MTDALRVGIVLKGGSAWMGGMEYMKNLLVAAGMAAAQDGTRVEFSIVSNKPIPEALARQVGSPLEWVQVADDLLPVRFGRFRRLFSSVPAERPLDHAVRNAGLDFVYPIDSLSGSIPSRRLAWIPDLQHRVNPEFSSEEELAARERWIDSMIQAAPGIVFSSQSARDDFAHHYPKASNELHVLPFRVKMAEQALSGDPGALVHEYRLPERFLLVSNQFWMHKNHTTLFESIRQAKEQCPDLVVVMTGALHDYRHPEYPDQCLQRIHKSGINGNVRILGLIPKHDQLQLLRACVAVVQPSLFEGWSTIVEEARLLGKRLLVSDLPVHREQDVAGAKYFAPRDAGTLAGLIGDAWEASTGGAEAVDSVAQCRSRYDKLFLEFGRAFLQLARHAGAMKEPGHR